MAALSHRPSGVRGAGPKLPNDKPIAPEDNSLMITRRAEVGDARPIAEVHIRSWRAAYMGQVLDEYLASLSVAERKASWVRIIAGSEWPSAGALVLIDDDRVVGFVSFGASRDEPADPETGEVMAICVEPEVWGAGGGRLLMDNALGLVRDAGLGRCTLWVLESNERARGFYEVGGWTADGSQRSSDSRGFQLNEVKYRRSLE